MIRLVVLALALVVQSAATPGAMLRVGQQLVYSSGGAEMPWTIDSLASDTTLGGRTGCVRLRLRLAPTAPQTTRGFCVTGDTLYGWDERTQSLRPARPLVANASLETRSPNGNTSRFETSALGVDSIGGIAIAVIPTVVVTRDSSGSIIRRLTERFSVGLLTATRGTFAVPDTSRPGGWRTQQEFSLVGIRNP